MLLHEGVLVNASIWFDLERATGSPFCLVPFSQIFCINLVRVAFVASKVRDRNSGRNVLVLLQGLKASIAGIFILSSWPLWVLLLNLESHCSCGHTPHHHELIDIWLLNHCLAFSFLPHLLRLSLHLWLRCRFSVWCECFGGKIPWEVRF